MVQRVAAEVAVVEIQSIIVRDFAAFSIHDSSSLLFFSWMAILWISLNVDHRKRIIIDENNQSDANARYFMTRLKTRPSLSVNKDGEWHHLNWRLEVSISKENGKGCAAFGLARLEAKQVWSKSSA